MFETNSRHKVELTLVSKERKMSDNVQNQQQQDDQPSFDRDKILCRVVDVEQALLSSFKRFVEENKASLEDLMLIAKEELSKMELFAPKLTDDASDEIELANIQQSQ